MLRDVSEFCVFLGISGIRPHGDVDVYILPVAPNGIAMCYQDNLPAMRPVFARNPHRGRAAGLDPAHYEDLFAQAELAN